LKLQYSIYYAKKIPEKIEYEFVRMEKRRNRVRLK
jgi:hypothetical protein